MGARGPKPLPANVHLLKGNPSKIPLDQLGDSVDPVIEVPGVPKHLWPEARKEWRRISALLVENRLVSKLDRSALALYCQWWAKWVWAEEQFTRSKNIAEARRQAHVEAAGQAADALARAGLLDSGPAAASTATGPTADGAPPLPARPLAQIEADLARGLPVSPDEAKIAAAVAAARLDAEATWSGGDGMMVPTPSGALIYNPHWVAARQAALYVDKFLASFGLNPSARGRVSPSNNRQGSLPFGNGDAPGGFGDL